MNGKNGEIENAADSIESVLFVFQVSDKRQMKSKDIIIIVVMIIIL
jgi:hypothetical protein